MQFLNVKISIRGCELQKKKTQENPENKKKKDKPLLPTHSQIQGLSQISWRMNSI